MTKSKSTSKLSNGSANSGDTTKKRWLHALLIAMISSLPVAAFAVDTDGDGLDDSIDPDDDNDGIPDQFELTVSPGSGKVEWTHNLVGGTSFAAAEDAGATGFFTSLDNMAFGSGFVFPTSNYEWILFGADTTTFADAKAQNEYAQVGFTANVNGSLDNLQHGNVGTKYNGSLADDFQIATEISSDNLSLIHI